MNYFIVLFEYLNKNYEIIYSGTTKTIVINKLILMHNNSLRIVRVKKIIT